MLSTRAIHFAADTPYFPAKTPARGTKNRGENAYQGAMTVQNAKGKANVMRTPFQLKTAEPQRLLKDALGPTKASIHLVNRPKPLADKTPFTNRTLNAYKTPGPEKKLLNFANPNKEHHPTPDTGSTRASSTRKHPRFPKTADNHFQTPANQGNHWDVSEDEIVAPEIEQVSETEVQMDFNDEIEYMAPNTLTLEYEPPFDFDLPDYKVLGQAASRSFYCYPQDLLPAPTFEFQVENDGLMKWDSLYLPSLSSDDRSSQSSKHSKKNAVQNTTRTTASTSRVGSAARSNALVTSRPPTVVSTRRPATSTSIRPSPLVPSAKPIIRPSSTMTIRGATTPATTSTITRKLLNTTSRLTTVPKKQPLTRPTSTHSTTVRPAATTTTTRPRAATTTTIRPVSRPPTSASVSRTFSSSSVRTTLPGSTVKSSTSVVKSTPVSAVVKKFAKEATASTAAATTTRSRATPTTMTRVPVVSRPSTTKALVPEATAPAAAEHTLPKLQSVNLEVATLEVVENGNTLDERFKEREAQSSSIGLPVEAESLEGVGRSVDIIIEEDSFIQEDGARDESDRVLEASPDGAGSESGRVISFNSGTA